MIFVTGTGRSGTSITAEILHETGVCMGHDLNVQCEDMIIRHQHLGKLLRGKVQSFIQAIQDVHKDAGCKAKEIGFKHPLLCGVSQVTWLELNPRVIYLCTREKKATIKSMVNFRKGKQKIASYPLVESFYLKRINQIKSNILGLDFLKVLDYSERRSTAWILRELRNV